MTFTEESGGKEIAYVYVRKGKTEDSRLVSFNRPDCGVDAIEAEVLNAGFAIDGRSYCYQVTPFTHVGYFYAQEGGPVLRYLHEDIEERSLIQALREVEVMIRDWLSEKGLLVYFT